MSRIGRSYKQHPVSGTWDTIVVGSGLGGLAAAGLLARHEGQRVLVLERHYTAGGFTHTFTRPGYEWDVGVHYVGDVHRERSLMRRMFDHLSDGELRWADLGEVYDTIIIGDDRYEFVAGREAFRRRMYEYFPRQTRAIDRYLERVASAVRKSKGFFMEKALPPAMATVAGAAMRWPACRARRPAVARPPRPEPITMVSHVPDTGCCLYERPILLISCSWCSAWDARPSVRDRWPRAGSRCVPTAAARPGARTPARACWPRGGARG